MSDLMGELMNLVDTYKMKLTDEEYIQTCKLILKTENLIKNRYIVKVLVPMIKKNYFEDDEEEEDIPYTISCEIVELIICLDRVSGIVIKSNFVHNVQQELPFFCLKEYSMLDLKHLETKGNSRIGICYVIDSKPFY